MSEYNGWTNLETWNVALHIDNDQGTQEFWLEQAREALETAWNKDKARTILADALEADHEENMPELVGTYADLLRAALGEVNWREIADHLIESAEEIGEE